MRMLELRTRLPVFEWYWKWRRYEDVLQQLRTFDELSLHDLGINKSDFESIARGTFRGHGREEP